jgi:hypothetical protein
LEEEERRVRTQSPEKGVLLGGCWHFKVMVKCNEAGSAYVEIVKN